jgi:protein TonB
MLERQMKSARGRWTTSTVASVLCHILIAVWVGWQGFEPPLPKPPKPQFMDVVLLEPDKSKPAKPAKDADTMSNRSVRGGNITGQDRSTRMPRSQVATASKPTPTPPAPSPTLPAMPAAPEPKPQKRSQVLARKGKQPEARRTPPKPETPPTPAPRRQAIPLQNLMPSTMALAQLSRDIAREKRLKKMLSREADIPINTREAKYAPYAQQLVRSLEDQWRPSQADYFNYQDDARQVLMKITIESTGDLSRLEVIRPSPIAGLTESAEAAVHAASPFRPLPSSWGLDRVTFYLIFEVVDNRFVFRTG